MGCVAPQCMKSVPVIYLAFAAVLYGPAEAFCSARFPASDVCGSVRQEPESDLSFETDIWDFGTIREEDGPVSHTFRFTNAGDAPVVIERVAVSCGCTTPSYSRRPVMPGEESGIGITFDPEMRPGRFAKTVTILSGGGRNRNVLKVKGVVAPRPRTVEEDYPFALAGGIRADMLHRGFGYVSHGEVKSMVINIVNTSGRTVLLDTVWAAKSGLLRMDFPRKLEPEEKAAVTLTYDLRGSGRYGMVSDGAYLTADGVRPSLPVNATAVAVDDFTGTESGSAPRADISPMFHDFGEKVGNRPLKKRFAIVNAGRSPLHIRAVSMEENTSTDLMPGIELQPDGKAVFEVVFRPQGSPGTPVFGGVAVITDDPQHPMREIRVGAVI